ncbi:hypothetical protein H6P81_020185 [Aristolochia fimbriata]|uniref:Uncharacterized protein n=1 Tax=Aristolochia fimbriata TaxID=158543 RepID=A0AAV7DVM7_ARIFI|nr:hypothetical protein H6P81_020185 [Aristolochia fimbriata]
MQGNKKNSSRKMQNSLNAVEFQSISFLPLLQNFRRKSEAAIGRDPITSLLSVRVTEAKPSSSVRALSSFPHSFGFFLAKLYSLQSTSPPVCAAGDSHSSDPSECRGVACLVPVPHQDVSVADYPIIAVMGTRRRGISEIPRFKIRPLSSRLLAVDAAKCISNAPFDSFLFVTPSCQMNNHNQTIKKLRASGIGFIFCPPSVPSFRAQKCTGPFLSDYGVKAEGGKKNVRCHVIFGRISFVHCRSSPFSPP